MFELVLLAPADRVELLSDALMDELGALSVSVEDADAGTESEQALFGEPGMPPPGAGWDRSTLRALFEDEAAAAEAGRLVLAQDWAEGVEALALQAVVDQDWVRLTQSQFEPVEITPEFFIVPSWHEPPAAARRVIRLDPGVAFGTGTHPTTRMCLRWIAARAARPLPPGAWDRVLDYGCGSGILAIAAALHGAGRVDAVDIDPAAVAATKANALANGLAVAGAASAGGATPAAMPGATPTPNAVLRAGLPEKAEGAYGLVLANILATPLKLLAPLLAVHVAPGGWLVLAGILERQTAELQAAYAPWLALEVADRQDGWVLLAARRP